MSTTFAASARTSEATGASASSKTRGGVEGLVERERVDVDAESETRRHPAGAATAPMAVTVLISPPAQAHGDVDDPRQASRIHPR